MTIQFINENQLSSDCNKCFGLCCVALPYAKSADFAVNKDGGTPCSNLRSDYQCSIHDELREKGYRGCTVYECFGAGQKVSQQTFDRKEWQGNDELAKKMFEVFPIMQQLHEMLYYLNEALAHEAAKQIHNQLQNAFNETNELTLLSEDELLKVDVSEHRMKINTLLVRMSELVRYEFLGKQINRIRERDFIGAKLKNANLRGMNLRGAFLIAADLRNADLRITDVIGADFRDADLSGANLTGAIFLTQAQINAAHGDIYTKLPRNLYKPSHWIS